MGSLRGVRFELGAHAAGGLSPLLIRAMVATCRVTCQSQDVLERARRNEAFIGVLWRQHLVFFGDLVRGSGFTILASRNRDGEIGARIAHRPGLRTVRGASSRGADEALAELIEFTRRGECIGFVADGPRGPSRIAKIGPIVAAKLSGRRSCRWRARCAAASGCARGTACACRRSQMSWREPATRSRCRTTRHAKTASVSDGSCRTS